MCKGSTRGRITFWGRHENAALGSALCFLAFANLTLREMAETVFFWPGLERLLESAMVVISYLLASPLSGRGAGSQVLVLFPFL